MKLYQKGKFSFSFARLLHFEYKTVRLYIAFEIELCDEIISSYKMSSYSRILKFTKNHIGKNSSEAVISLSGDNIVG